ncbi:amidohydrolase [Porticoccaceae bacterium]|nr:amidohydrolase [Porticoccaceae bacterium]MDC0011230.1 amidohydrolase [Porticoccaceae bacterium]
MRSVIITYLWLLSFPFAGSAASSAESLDINSVTDDLVIYTAKKIITMESALPEATAVAVANGRIVSVGSLESLSSWTGQKDARIDRRFEGKVIMPGFIDPHVHPSLPAVLTQFPFIAPDDWSLPTGEFPGAKTPEAYLKRLKQLVAEHSDESVPFIAWGYHPLWHGDLFREELTALFPGQPVMLWHRSFHEIVANDAALEMLDIKQADLAGNPLTDWAKGHFYENGMYALIPKMPFLFDPARFGSGMENFIQMVHQGGVTTALDMGTGVFGNPDAEIDLIRHTVETLQAPARLILTPIITDFIGRGVSIEDALVQVDKWRAQNSHRVMFDRRFKLMIDGAIYSGLAQFKFPGYIDGHQGVWMVPAEVSQQWAQAFWDASYQIHAHTNGDGSAEVLIDLLKTLQKNTPKSDHRLALEHFAYTTEDQNRQLAELGAVVSANPYYHYMLSDMYSDQWLGADRGSQMVRLGSLERLGMPFAFHSDSPMAPLQPLTLVSAAVNRVTINGNLAGANERVSLHAALRAITIDAAWVMGWEDEIGSIRAGKKADFTILEADPYQVGSKDIKDIKIWGTVFEGLPAPL